MVCAESEVSAESEVIKSKYVDGVKSLKELFAQRSVRRSVASFSPNATIPAYFSLLRLQFYPKSLIQSTHPRETPHPTRQFRQEREIHRQPGKARHCNRRIRG